MHSQPVALSRGEVVGVVGRGDLDDAGAEGRVHEVVENQR